MKKVALTLIAALALLVSVMAISATADLDPASPAYRNSISADLKNGTYLAELSDGCTAVCPFCNAPVTWTDVGAGGNVTAAGHYFLSQNAAAFIDPTGAICLYLNGYDLEAAGSVAAHLSSGNTLTIMGKGAETISGKNYNSSATRIGATMDIQGGTLNLCGGTYTKNNSYPGPVMANRDHAATINIYEGTTVTGGVNTDLGGNIALHVGGAKLNIYGGTISNGKGTTGGNIIVNGDGNCEVNISGGTITGGVSTSSSGRGGNIASYYGDINVSGGRIENGSAYIGGNITVIRSGSELKISGGTITGGTAKHGGNIRTQEGAVMTMTGGTVSNGIATGATNSQGGNINANEGSVTVSGGTISGGSSTDCGGNIFLNPATTMSVSGTANITGGNGGTIGMNKATLTMTGGTVTGGTYKLGAALYMYGGSTATVSGGTINGGTATDGGAVRVQESSTFTLSGGTVTGGTATSQGGNFSVKAGCTLNITSGSVTEGTSTNQGGNIYAEDATVKISGGTVSGGHSTNSYGGNIAVGGGSLTTTAGTVSGGHAKYGGNIYLFSGAKAGLTGLNLVDGTANNGGNLYINSDAGTVTLEKCTVTGGTQEGSGGVGGNVCAEAPMSAINCTFSQGGGYIRNLYHSAAVTLKGCTLSDVGTGSRNTVRSDADLTLIDTTVTDSYMLQTKGTITLSGSTVVHGVLPGNDVTKLHVAADFTGIVSIDGLEKPTDPFYTGVMDETRYTSGGSFTGIVKLGDATMQPQLHGVDGKLVVSAARLQNFDTGAYAWYLDAEAAIRAYNALDDQSGYYVHLACGADVVVPAGMRAVVNFNGETPANITLGEGAKLYAYDDCSEAGAGSLSYSTFNTTKLEKVFRAPNGLYYLAVDCGNGQMKTAAVDLAITSITLRPSTAGLYYGATIRCAEEVKPHLTYGIAVQLNGAPGENFKSTSLYTAETGAVDNANGVLINEILKEGHVLKTRADSTVYAVVYVEYDGQSAVSAPVGYSLTDVMSLMNQDIDAFSREQKQRIKAFYDTYAAQVGWQFEGIEQGTLQPGEEGKTLKVLTLGHSLALDSNHMLTRIAAAEGYENMQIGTLYYSGCSLSQHVRFLQNNEAVYNLHISSTKTPDTPPAVTQGVTMAYALAYDYWDYVIMQGGVFEIADHSAFKNGNIQTIQAYVREKCSNPNVKFAWHMHWTPPVTQSLRDQYDYQDDYYNKSYAPYNNDRNTLYRTNVKRVQDNILTDSSFRFVIPTGTVMENAVSSYLEETDLYRDYVHSSDLARVMNAYLWYCKLAGVEQLTELKMDTIPTAFFNSTQGTQDRVLTEAEKAVILESVNNALKTPFSVTQSQYASVQVGYSKVNITPSYSVALGGYGNYENRIFDQVLDDVYLTCISVSNAEQTVLIYTCDNLFWLKEMSNDVRPLITAATGVPAENIFFSATHTHGAPYAAGNYTGTQKYRSDLLAWAVEAAQAAMADQGGAMVFTGSGQIENMNFVRHYLCSDGTYMGSNHNEDKADKVVSHASDPDREMTVIKFARTGSKKSVVLVNWQAHPDHTGENGQTVLTADFPGPMRDKLEKDTGSLVAYFSGASGNLSYTSRIQEVAPGLNRVQYGEKLANHAKAILENMTMMTDSTIKTLRRTVTVNVDHSRDGDVKNAQKVCDEGNSTLGKIYMKAYNFYSVYHASAVINRASMPATENMELSAFCIGDIGFVNGTYEMFSENAMYIKGESPFATTFIMQGNHVYLPSEKACQYGCYEADTTYYEHGTAEDLANAFVEMLEQLKR